MTLEEIIASVSNIGLAGALCFYVLHTTNAKLDALTQAFAQQHEELAKIVACMTSVTSKLEGNLHG